MKKFLAVVKREYIARVRAKMFIVSTVLLPVVMSLFAIVPAIIFSIQTPPLRVAVVDQTGKLYEELKQSLDYDATDQDSQSDNANFTRSLPRGGVGNFRLEDVNAASQPLDEIRANLDQRMRARELDGYLILPPDFLSTGKAEFFNRNLGDIVSARSLQSALNRATREQRLIEAKVDNKTRQDQSRRRQRQCCRSGT
jgi:ABC-2 type transport system permease protein